MRTIHKRRRRENRTDYKARLRMLHGKTDRIVIRKTNRYIICQQVSTKEAQDSVKLGVNSKDLLEFGWDKKNIGSLKSMPAAYLAGLLLARKIGKGKFFIDIGMTRNTPGRIYSAVKGLVDGGLEINTGIKLDEKRLQGEHTKIKELVNKVKEKILKSK